MCSLDQNQLQGSLGVALVATLSTDIELRHTLLQGACFFTLAAGKSDYGNKEQSDLNRAEQHRLQLKGQEAQADGVVALIEGSLRRAVEEVHAHHTLSFVIMPLAALHVLHRNAIMLGFCLYLCFVCVCVCLCLCTSVSVRGCV